MKNNLFMTVAVIFGCAISSSAFSDNAMAPTMTTTPTAAMSSTKAHPCKNIAMACKTAGKGTNKHELWENCVKPIIAGQTVTGVTVNPSDVKSCQAIMQMRHKNFAPK